MSDPDGAAEAEAKARAETEGAVAAERTDAEADDGGRRDVVVPMPLYKTVTVFSTLIAVGAVVLGFTLLDAATLDVSLVRSFLVAALAAAGLSPAPDVLSAVLGVLGLATIGFGAGVYTLGTRFRAPGMGNAQEDASEGSDDG